MIRWSMSDCQRADVLCYIGVMHVFTYGTLMYSEVWQAVAGRTFAAIRGQAPGFAIFRVCDAVFPGILATADAVAVQGVVYLDVGSDTIERLDQFEDDFYVRQTVSVDCEDGRRRDAQAYVVPVKRRDVLTDEPWSAEEFVARGYLEQFRAGFAGFQRLSRNER